MYHLLINPASQSGKGKKIWKEQVEPLLNSRCIHYRAYFSKRPGDIERLTRLIIKTSLETGQKPVKLILLGGDGSVNELLQGIDHPEDILLGYIPTGSSNDLARDLALPKDPKEMLRHILAGNHIHCMDLGCVTYEDGSKRYFDDSCGIGYDASVCQDSLLSPVKNIFNRLGLGKLTYLGVAIAQLFRTKTVACRLTIDDVPVANFKKILFIANMIHRYEGGGFCFCPDAKDNDGMLDLCAVGDIPKLLILAAFPTAFWGKHYLFPGIHHYTGKSIRIETDKPLWVHTDGEVFRKSKSITVTCEKAALRVLL